MQLAGSTMENSQALLVILVIVLAVSVQRGKQKCFIDGRVYYALFNRDILDASFVKAYLSVWIAVLIEIDIHQIFKVPE